MSVYVHVCAHFSSHQFLIEKQIYQRLADGEIVFAGALTLASVLLYPKTLGGGAVFSGWVPFNSSIVEQITPEAKRVLIFWNIVIYYVPSYHFFFAFFVKLSLSYTLSIFLNGSYDHFGWVMKQNGCREPIWFGTNCL